METRQSYDIVRCMRGGEDYIFWIRQGSIILSSSTIDYKCGTAKIACFYFVTPEHAPPLFES